VFTDTLADQTFELGDAERSGLLGLWQSIGFTPPGNARDLFVNFG
jgi:hypothetical protein